MKNPLRLFFAFVSLCALCLFAVHAQTVAADPVAAVAAPADDTNAAAGVANAIVGLLSAVMPAKLAGWLVAIGSVVGVLRLAFKPLVTAIESYVKSTPSPSDDEFVNRVEHTRAFTLFAWCLDFFASIKVGPQFTAKSEMKS